MTWPPPPHSHRRLPGPPSGEPRITATFVAAPLRDVLFTFSEFAGISIVPGADVSGIVSADIRDQPWEEALRVILDSHGLAARELENGILRVDDIENLNRREDVEPLETRVLHMSYATATDLLPAVQSLLSDRGSASLSLATNSVIVMDVPRVLAQAEALVQELDIRAPQITISARIVFVNRTGLEELGVAYDLRDSRGQQSSSPIRRTGRRRRCTGGGRTGIRGTLSTRTWCCWTATPFPRSATPQPASRAPRCRC